MEKKRGNIHSAIVSPKEKKGFSDNGILLSRLQEVKNDIFSAFSQLQAQYRIHFPSEPSLFQRLTTMIKNYSVLGKRKEVMDEIVQLPSISFFSPHEDFRSQILRDDTDIQSIQEELFIRNENLVYPVIPIFRKNPLFKMYNTFYEELRQAGFISLMMAIDKYDLSKKVAFSTYARRCIIQGIQRALGKYGRTIMLGAGTEEDFNLVYQAQQKLPEEERNNPTKLFSVIQEMTQPVDGTVSISLGVIAQILTYQKISIESLDKPVGEGEQSILSDFISSNEVVPGHEKRNEELIEVLSAVPRLTSFVLQMIIGYNGLRDGQSLSFEALGRQYGKSYEYIRQIYLKGLKIIKEEVKKDPMLDRDLRSFI